MEAEFSALSSPPERHLIDFFPSGLFLKHLIIFWYTGLACRVKWGDNLSQWFCLKAGVRQGGVLSPCLYCLYVDALISQLENLKVGCYILEVFMAALLYADDMALISPSIKGLQILLDQCSVFCDEWDICINAKKSKAMYFGEKMRRYSSAVLE